MLFDSLDFFIFLPIVFLLYWFVFDKKLIWQNALILLASYVFYGWWDWRFLLLLILSTLIDFSFGLWIESSIRWRKALLWFSIVNNLGILAVFKYYNFFAANFESAMSSMGWQVHPYFLHIILPVGISFYTFHGMSYVFDIYRKVIKPERNFINYAVFVSFFPLLVAGPIERAHHLLPQVIRPRRFDYRQAVDGLKLMLWGLFKKVIIADALAIFVKDIFGNYNQQSGSVLALGAVYFAFQIYCDFSGYSDIAIGTAKLFGMELLTNFKFPYFSRDIAEFWRRWHISLSSWFRDYVYIPLGGSKGGKWQSLRNIWIIFLLSGFWHGANWTFMAWGAIHASMYIPLFLLGQNRKHVGEVVAEYRALPTARELWGMLTTFAVVCLAWVFFRAPTIGAAIGYLSRMFSRDLFSIPSSCRLGILYIIPLLVVDWICRRDERKTIFEKLPFTMLRFAIYVILAFVIINKLFSTHGQQFIYFQF